MLLQNRYPEESDNGNNADVLIEAFVWNLVHVFVGRQIVKFSHEQQDSK
jgi:hypothetical protein